MFNLQIALVAALDAAAPDQGTWLAGRDAFRADYAKSHSVGKSLSAALDAAAPDQGTWLAGRDAFKKLYPLGWFFKGVGLVIGLVIGLLIAGLLGWSPASTILFVLLTGALVGWLSAYIEARNVRAATES